MWISNVSIQNVKGFSQARLNFSQKVNILVGANNSGKSTILRALALLQPFENQINSHKLFGKTNTRIGQKDYSVTVGLSEPTLDLLRLKSNFDVKTRKELNVQFTGSATNEEAISSGVILEAGQVIRPDGWFFSMRQPMNFLFPFFARRKPVEFDERIDALASSSIEDTFRHLYAKIDRIANPSFPEYEQFKEICEQVFGFSISCHPSSNGKQAGWAVTRESHIPIAAMGEGTVNLLSFLAQLLTAEGKVFLIEELENDIHPKALKVLLDLIIRKSETNQFIISTHSNIVVKYAGTVADAKLFKLSMKLEQRIPTSTVAEIPNTPESRIKVLEDLGYDVFDFELWKAYLILEESSAESIIREVLIPNFAPKLGSTLRTIAAGGNADVEARFSDFLRLFVYIHTSSAYKERAWVAVDGDETGEKIIGSLQKRFSTWNETHFRTFKQPQFEKYYPAQFQERATKILSMAKSDEKRNQKTSLAKDVIAWAKENPQKVKTEFTESAAEIIDFLTEIERRLQG